ncbi:MULTISPECIES: [citrate (pro-3S)-lyase] ligase [Clostridium]|uniref:[Citrate [pro-3S]-lyase] ligase n=1 Tax=Clostridium faecium TaxID=2762223 RepID=A0ABR8YNF0_9CLOT|nr:MULTISPECIES: [citrate (pro-3S)-lyase] ligase [Clostridium]MBD8045581.1 [citrate (pro-3S)-lyase] ligase [Clostridium faecium]MDU1349924.1 [citrate (pro-3S)-lyase] ligase [Clostridium argentinense]
MYNLNLEKINLNKDRDVLEVKDFLKKFNLDLDNDVDYTVVIRQEGEIKATCSKAKSVFKCFAVSEELRGEGVSAILLNGLNDRLFEENIYHSFIFTKPENIEIFSGLGYKLIETVEKVALLENGIYNIESYLYKLSKKYNLEEKKERSSLVMNCNPFTLGHLYLIEEAAKVSEEVLVFIVEENKSLFPFDVRYNLVKNGTEHLRNVKVIPGGEYIISSATFPSYFLRKKDDILEAYTSLDGKIFGKYFCNKFNINKRFIGEEPYCQVTSQYNKSLKEILPKFNVDVIEIPRKSYEDIAISASKVRELIKEENMNKIKEMVPKVTYDFLNAKEGVEIREKIKLSNSPH